MRFLCLLVLCCSSLTIPLLADDGDEGTADPVTLEQNFSDTEELPLRKHKPGPLQSVSFEGTNSIGGGFNVHSLQIGFGTGIPLGSFENILAVEPAVRVDLFDQGRDADLPDELYDIGVQLFWRRELNERWGMMTIVSPSMRSDLESFGDGFRLFALGLLTYDWVPGRLKLSGGVVALGRSDLPLLPAIGLTWTPNSRWKVDVNFPKPKLAYRIFKQGSECETWIYLQGGLGGNSWTVTLDDRSQDVFSFREIQMALGCEYLQDGGSRVFLELGTAFSREMEWERSQRHLGLGNSFLMNAGFQW